METLNDTNISNSIKASLKTSYTYTDYRHLVTDLVGNESTTGNDKSEDMVEYTKLNDKRMKRWDKTIKLTEDTVTRLANFKGNVTWIVITESWCGDAAHVVPPMAKLAEQSDNISLKLVLRDTNDELMNQFLTNGGKSVPKLIMVETETLDVLHTFGPRPAVATKLVADYKAKHGMITPQIKEDLQVWYNKDKGQSTIEELLSMLGV
ncbi:MULTISPECIES: thioredoxin family protein [Bizionia]|uniref:Thioredoxin family protein n=1 Tax=Bizionia algoritergicola TaxID=291187 RepID=A0A5D0R1D5_9FLAO|nr:MULTISPECIES: thioredoxin family protein [Bizionia]OBX21352.1 thioredoxin [Bizionia sp. APA-3]TYB74805.1 thioredoxin family protein [Bizionia algoritergicola]